MAGLKARFLAGAERGWCQDRHSCCGGGLGPETQGVTTGGRGQARGVEPVKSAVQSGEVGWERGGQAVATHGIFTTSGKIVPQPIFCLTFRKNR